MKKKKKTVKSESLQVEWVPIESVVPYEKNPRANEAAVEKVALSIKEYGWKQPIVVDKDMVVIAGHTRLKAAIKLGLKKVPVHVARDLTAKQVKAYRIMDNRSHEMSNWDFPLLREELTELEVSGYDLVLTGWALEDLDYKVDYDQEWQGMPEFEQEKLDCYKELKVYFLNKRDYKKFAKLIKRKLTEKTKVIWFPKQDFDQNARNEVFSDES